MWSFWVLKDVVRTVGTWRHHNKIIWVFSIFNQEPNSTPALTGAYIYFCLQIIMWVLMDCLVVLWIWSSWNFKFHWLFSLRFDPISCNYLFKFNITETCQTRNTQVPNLVWSKPHPLLYKSSWYPPLSVWQLPLPQGAKKTWSTWNKHLVTAA